MILVHKVPVKLMISFCISIYAYEMTFEKSSMGNLTKHALLLPHIFTIASLFTIFPSDLSYSYSRTPRTQQPHSNSTESLAIPKAYTLCIQLDFHTLYRKICGLTILYKQCAEANYKH